MNHSDVLRKALIKAVKKTIKGRSKQDDKLHNISAKRDRDEEEKEEENNAPKKIKTKDPFYNSLLEKFLSQLELGKDYTNYLEVLPDEVIIDILENIDNDLDLINFAKTSDRIYNVLKDTFTSTMLSNFEKRFKVNRELAKAIMIDFGVGTSLLNYEKNVLPQNTDLKQPDQTTPTLFTRKLEGLKKDIENVVKNEMDLYKFFYMISIEKGLYNIVKYFISSEKVNPYGNNNFAFKRVIMKNRLNLVNLFLDSKKLKLTTDLVLPSLLYAIKKKYNSIVKVLLDDDRIDPTVNSNEILKFAIKNSNKDVVKMLLTDARIDPTVPSNEDILGYSINFDDPEIVSMILKHPFVDASENNNSILFIALQLGNYEIIKMLIERDEIDVTSNNNYALQIATYKDFEEIVELLLQNPRVDPSANDSISLSFACLTGNVEIVKMFIKYERVNQANRNNAPIRWACIAGHHEIVELLLKNSVVDPTVNDNECLKVSSIMGYSEIVSYLMKSNKKVDPTASFKSVGVLMTCISGYDEVLELLVKDPNVDLSIYDNLPIRLASFLGHADIVKILLNDPKVNIRADENFSIHASKFGNHEEVNNIFLLNNFGIEDEDEDEDEDDIEIGKNIDGVLNYRKMLNVINMKTGNVSKEYII